MAECQLVASAFALLRNPLEMFNRHIGLFYQKPTLITADAGLDAEPCLSVDAMTHYAHVNQVRKGCHKRIFPRVSPMLVQDTCPYVGAALRVKSGFEMILFIVNNVFHSLFFVRLLYAPFFDIYYCITRC